MKIWITTQFVGFHKWGNAPCAQRFLRDTHRHLFKVKLWVEVKHDDRDVEFFALQEQLQNVIGKNIDKEDTGSCEQIAKNILKGFFEIYYFDKWMQCEISEDGESGAIVDTEDLYFEDNNN